MYNFLLIISILLQIAILLCIILYAPFSKSWWRAIGVSFSIALAWVVLRFVMIFNFREPDVPPLMGFFFVPPFVTAFAIGARAIKVAISESRRNKKKGEGSTSAMDAPPIIKDSKSKQQNQNE